MTSWVVGRGLLGSAVCGALGERRRFDASERVPWGTARAAEALRRGAKELAAQVRDEWEVLWCAGAGVIATSKEDLAREVEAWKALLAALESERLVEKRGRIFLASSAGGVYAGSEGAPFTEATPPAPLSDYGRAKLEEEAALAAWAAPHANVSWLAGRISTLYGPGQDLRKPQGLIAQMCRSLIHQSAIHVYVPLDTMRDYLYSDDCARMILASLDRLAAERAKGVTRIIASGVDTTVSSLIGMLRRLSRKQIKVVCGLHPMRGRHPMRLSYRSAVWPEERASHTPLIEGLRLVQRDLLQRYERGTLPPATS